MCVAKQRWGGQGEDWQGMEGERGSGGGEGCVCVFFFFSFLDSATKAVRANNECGEWCVSGGGTEPC